MADIRIPFDMALVVLKVHLLHKLIKKGYTFQMGLRLLNNPIGNDVETLKTIFQELLRESPGGKGIPCTVGNEEHIIVGIDRGFNGSPLT